MQDTHLKGNVDQLATGNFLLHWNQPTRIASGYGFNNGVPNRGQLLSTIPQVKTSVLPSPVSNASFDQNQRRNVNVQNILNSVDSTPFNRINKKSTVYSYPGIKNILINQKKDEEDSVKKLNESLVNDCSNCSDCAGCPMCLLNNQEQQIKANNITDPVVNNKSESLNIEKFDSGLTSSVMPSKMYKLLGDKLINNCNKCKNKKVENFDSNNYLSVLNKELRENTNGCANCPQSRCINCPLRNLSKPQLCANSDECELGYPCSTCKTKNYLNARDQVVDDHDHQVQQNTEDFSSINAIPTDKKCSTCPKNTFIDLASFGNGEGGYRLGTNWNNATTGPSPIDVTESLVYYPDSYVGSYFINPTPDIMHPYAVIPSSRTVGGLIVDKK
jgi:hypothetical protein